MIDTTYITKQTHPTYSLKYDTWIQISKSYSGGVTYRDGNYLHKFSLREGTNSYNERKKRAVYINDVQPLSEMFAGFLISSDTIRENLTLEYLVDNANRNLSMDQFMAQVAVNSLLYPCGVLVDSPSFSRDTVKTEGDRAAAGLNPYCVLYQPWQIRNFNVGADGKLNWLLLDNTYYDNSDPFVESQINVVYRLWTREYFQDFKSVVGTSQLTSTVGFSQFYGMSNYIGSFEASEPIIHGLNEIPFTFCNWADRTGTFLADTIFEDIVLFVQGIYNYMSLLDEALYGGLFKTLACEGKIPEELKACSGFSNFAAFSYEVGTKTPQYIGPELNNIEQFLNAINFLLTCIKRALGLDTDQEKSYAQSGEAKKFDFTKVKALLNAGAYSMERIEHEIFRFAGLWEGKDEDVIIEYRKDFLGVEEEMELERLFKETELPYLELAKTAAKRIAQINHGDMITPEEMKAIEEDIDSTEKEEQIDMNKLADMERAGAAMNGWNGNAEKITQQGEMNEM